MTLFTIGHGNRSADRFQVSLRDHGIAWIVDVRSYPASRRWPWFGRGELEPALARAGIGYTWLGRALGGRRRWTRACDNHHPGLQSAAMRAFAEHMAGPRFRDGLDEALPLAASARTALLCAEIVPEHCHRALIADCVVLLHDRPVRHLLPDGTTRRHAVTTSARIAGTTLVYDGGVSRSFDFPG